jgi:hypothetical protein
VERIQEGQNGKKKTKFMITDVISVGPENFLDLGSTSWRSLKNYGYRFTVYFDENKLIQ